MTRLFTWVYMSFSIYSFFKIKHLSHQSINKTKKNNFFFQGPGSSTLIQGRRLHPLYSGGDVLNISLSKDGSRVEKSKRGRQTERSSGVCMQKRRLHFTVVTPAPCRRFNRKMGGKEKLSHLVSIMCHCVFVSNNLGIKENHQNNPD